MGRTVAVPCGRVGFRALEAERRAGAGARRQRRAALLPGRLAAAGRRHCRPARRTGCAPLLERCRRRRDEHDPAVGGGHVRQRGAATASVTSSACSSGRTSPSPTSTTRSRTTRSASSVEREARDFLARGGNHASLAVLCGNSEIEQQVGMLGLDPELGRGPLFAELLPGLARELDGRRPLRDVDADRGRAAVPAQRRRRALLRRRRLPPAARRCTPGGGEVRGRVSRVRERPGRRRPSRSWASRRRARLVHHPAWKAGVPRDAGAGWDFDDVRDHYLRELFGVDPVELRSIDPERYLALSRVVTGEVMAATLGEWRRARSTCRGALLWTLNDMLPGAGWGILDSRGRPRLRTGTCGGRSHPVAVWTTDEGTNGIAVHAANETAEPVQAEIAVTLLRARRAGARGGPPRAGARPAGRRWRPPSRGFSIASSTPAMPTASGRQPTTWSWWSCAWRDGHGRACSTFRTGCRHGSRRSRTSAWRRSVRAAGRQGGRRRRRAPPRVRGDFVEAPGFEPTDDVFSVGPGRTHTLELLPHSARRDAIAGASPATAQRGWQRRTADGRSVNETVPLVLDGAQPLAAVLTLPGGGIRRSRGVVVCSPLGHENICSYRPLRALAEHLADHGWPVLRFDWAGCGDSADAPPEPEISDLDRRRATARWLGSRVHAGVDEVALVGLRVGATLGMLAARRRRGRHRPRAAGALRHRRAYLRELRVVRGAGAAPRQSVAAPGNRSGRRRSSERLPRHSERGRRCSKRSTWRHWKRRRSRSAGARPDPPQPERGVTALVERLERDVPDVVYEVSPELASAWDDTSRLPPSPRVCAELCRTGSRRSRPTRAQFAGRRAPEDVAVLTTDGVREETIASTRRLAATLVGVDLRARRRRAGARWVVFLNAGGVGRSGPNRLWTTFARAWAKAGLPSLRLDVSGVGDSDAADEVTRGRVHRRPFYTPTSGRRRRCAVVARAGRGRRRRSCSSGCARVHTGRSTPLLAGANASRSRRPDQPGVTLLGPEH